MDLNAKHFQHLVKNDQAIITLIGMSNIGKTTWAKKLATEAQFAHIDFDYLISQKLQKELEKDHYDITDLANWLGQPYEARFPLREEKIKQLEKEVAEEVLNRLDRETQNENIILDTPGSIIYTGEETCMSIKQHSLIIYIQATPEMLDGMLKSYFDCPKPIIWNNVFEKHSGEDNLTALKRCYPKLLQSRHELYQKYADIVIPYPQLDCEKKNTDDFFKIISSYLPQ